MVDFAVMPAGFDAAVDAAQRQAEYMRNIRSYVDAHTNLGDMSGLVMACLGPMYESARNNAVTGLADGEGVADAIHEHTTKTQTAYEEVDSGLGRSFNSIGSNMATDYEAPSLSYGEGELGPRPCVAVNPLTAPAEEAPSAFGTIRSVAGRWADRTLERTPWGTTYVDGSGNLAQYADTGGTPFRDRYEAWLLRDDPNLPEGASRRADRWRDRAGFATDYAYASGRRTAEAVDGFPEPPPTSNWVHNEMTARTTRAAGTALDLYDSVSGAYGASQEYLAADARADRVSDLANGPATSSENVDWANR